MTRQRETPETTGLAEGFAERMGAWARRSTADPVVAETLAGVAGRLCAATLEGHVCLSLTELADPGAPLAALRERLLATPLVARAESPGGALLVLDANDRLYLRRHFDYEQRLARRLTRASRPMPGEPLERAGALLDVLFPASPDRAGRVDWQRVATILALQRGLTVISGGPGTGKTTTVVSLLACLLGIDPACRIVLAAPTGKAAARMIEAVRSRASNLPEAVRARLPSDASTVHRLLGFAPGRGFAHDASRTLPIDVLVVDEASMLDLALATRLFEAVPDSARIILLGDKDQLEAVESGAVFAELSAAPAYSDATRHALAAACKVAPDAFDAIARPADLILEDAAVWLTESHRFAGSSDLGRLAQHLLNAPSTETVQWLRSEAGPSVRWIGHEGGAAGAAMMQAALSGFEGYRDAIARPETTPAGATAAFARFRVLCAMREGPRGTRILNERIGRWLQGEAIGSSTWYPGRPVMIVRNDYALGLFNGDVGITLADQDGSLRVWFSGREGQFRSLSPTQLPAHETAFAMTIHKSQGSEFASALVILPDRPGRVAGRELVYTAVTRARESVVLQASEAVLRAAIESPSLRRSGLRARLREAAASR
jgi:exodeoxyribonuclease V alpha subunit